MIQLYQKDQEDHLQPRKLDQQVAYSAVNRADTLQRQGRYPVPPGSPQVRDGGFKIMVKCQDLRSRCKVNPNLVEETVLESNRRFQNPTTTNAV